jgi:uncharacterized protein YndB with AHSA1/START domain
MDCNGSIVIKAPLERVMRALTDDKELIRWFVTSAKSDPKKGGKYSFTVEFSKSSEVGEKVIVNEGEYLEVTPNKVSYTMMAGGEFILKDAEKSYPSVVVFSLSRKGDATEVTLVHSGLKKEDVEDYKGGWGWCLDNLKGYLERGHDKRPEEGQIVK